MPPRILRIVAVLLLVAADLALAVCTPTLQWSWDADVEAPAKQRLCSNPMVVQLTDDDGDGEVDADDTPDVLVLHCGTISLGCQVTALDGATGSQHFRITAPDLKSAELAAGDIDGDGMVEIIAAHRNDQQLVAFENDGALKWTSEVFPPAPTLTTRQDPHGLADFDQDGIPEIYASTRVLAADGRLIWSVTTGSTGQHVSNAADIDPSRPGLELVAGPRAFDRTGGLLWAAGAARGYTAIADFDGDGDPEVVLASSELALLDHRGNPLGPAHRVDGGWLAQPVVADFDGDGDPEVLAIDRARIQAVSWTGSGFTLDWDRVVDDPSGATAASAFDFDGDGDAEIVYHDHVGWSILDGASGGELWTSPLPSATGIEAPVIADVDGDCVAEVVITGCAATGPGNRLEVWQCDAARTPRPLWNQYAYHVTNIDDDGTIPAVENASWQRGNSWLGQTEAGATAVTADAGPDVTVCEGQTVTLDGSASRGCATPTYRWLDGALELCASTSPLCDVTPSSSTVYTVEVSCGAAACATGSDRDTVTVTVEPDVVPGDLGNTVRAVKAVGSVLLSWASAPNAASYTLHRGTVKGAWPSPPYRSGLAATTDLTRDLAAPPPLYYYRVSGASCSGIDGP